MRLAVGSAGVAILLIAACDPSDGGATALVRRGATLQFMHAMATIACATFMNVGARGASFAPVLFLAGAALACGADYARALGAPPLLEAARAAGCALLVAGWAVLFWAGRTIDPAPASET